MIYFVIGLIVGSFFLWYGNNFNIAGHVAEERREKVVNFSIAYALTSIATLLIMLGVFLASQ